MLVCPCERQTSHTTKNAKWMSDITCKRSHKLFKHTHTQVQWLMSLWTSHQFTVQTHTHTDRRRKDQEDQSRNCRRGEFIFKRGTLWFGGKEMWIRRERSFTPKQTKWGKCLFHDGIDKQKDSNVFFFFVYMWPALPPL